MIAGTERGSLLEHFEDVARAAVRLVFQTALENEVTEFFGRVLTPGRATQVASASARAPATATSR